jgi:hypothetical protein
MGATAAEFFANKPRVKVELNGQGHEVFYLEGGVLRIVVMLRKILV